MYGYALWKESQMARAAQGKKLFVKVSGDEFLTMPFLEWVKERSRDNKLVICVGGGTQINAAFQRHGLEIKKHPVIGRDTTHEGHRVAYAVLQENKSLLNRS